MAILIRKLKTLDPKKALATVLLAGLTVFLLSSPFAKAQGPEFNRFPISYQNEINTDLPLLDAKNVSRGEGWSVSQSDHDAGVQASAGEIIQFSIYYHNGVADTNENVAINTQIQAFASPSLGNSSLTQRISASLGAQNAATVTSSQKGSDINISIEGGTPLALNLVPGSVTWYKNWGSRDPRNGGPDISQVISLPDTIFSGENIGEIQGCFQYSGFINFRLQVTEPPPPQQRDLSIQKTVRNFSTSGTFADSIPAQPGQTVEFRLVIGAQGNSRTDNVIVRDSMQDGRLELIPGSVHLDADVFSDAQFFGNGVNVGSMNPGELKTVFFTAKVAPASSFSAGTNTLSNLGLVRGDGVTEKSDTASVQVTTSPPPPAQRDLTIQKTVRNFSTSGTFADSIPAQPGQTVEFRLVIGAQGNSRTDNVIVRDSMQDGRLELIPGSVHLDADVFSDAQFFGNGVNVGSMNPGELKTVFFTAKVAPASSFSAGTNTLSNLGLVRGDGVTEKSDTASVQVTTSPPPPATRDLSITKLVQNVSDGTGFSSSVPADPGERVRFRISVTTTGNASQNNVILRDLISDSRLSFVTGSMRLDNAPVANEFALFGSGLNLGNVGANITRILMFDGNVASTPSFTAGITTNLNNFAVIRSDQVSDRQAQASVNVTVSPSPPPATRDLSITKLVQNVSDNTGFGSSTPADPGERIRFRISVTITGDAAQNNVILRDLISDSRLSFILGSMTLDGAAFSQESALFGGGVNLGNLAPNITKILVFEANAASASSFTAGITTNLNNFALVHSDEVSDRQAQASASVTVSGSPPPPNRDLTITKRIQNINDNTSFSTSVAADPGERVRFEIVVNTTGNASQSSVILRDVISDNRLSFISGSMRLEGNTVSQEAALFGSGLSLGNLPQNTTRTLTFEANVAGSGSFTSGITTTLSNTAYVRSNEVSERSSTANANVTVGQATVRDLSITKRVRNLSDNTSFSNSVTADPGEIVRFEILITTLGNTAQNNVIIRDNLPARLFFSSGDSSILGSGINLGTLSPDTTRTFTFDAQVSGGGSAETVTNTALVRSNEVGERSASSSVNISSGSVSNLITDLSIDKRVRNISRNETLFRDSISASPGERLQYQILINIFGNTTQTNVIVRDNLDSRLSFISGDSAVFGSGINFGTLFGGSQHTVTYEVLVAGNSVFPANTITSVVNTAIARSDQGGQRSDNAFVNVQPGAVSGVSFQLRKTAFNLTKGVDATTVAADPGDTIEYTLYYKNTGQTTITGVGIEDDLRDVLELSQMTNTGAAVVDSNVIRFPVVDVPAGTEISRSFRVQVREASAFPASSDQFMVNVYGNEVRITVRKPQVAGIIARPPRTGPAEWLMVGLALLTTMGYWIYRRSNFKTRMSNGAPRLKPWYIHTRLR